VGSVFSPTYFRARARELSPEPTRFCAINVALYREGGTRWAFTEHPHQRVRRSRDAFELGGSRLAWEGDALVIHVDERSAGMGLPLRGTVRLRPRHCFDHPLALDPHGRHGWWAVAPRADIEVEMERPGFRFRGSGYHDTNFGREPLERGFSTWDWSRAELAEGTAVLYDARTPKMSDPEAAAKDSPACEHGLLFRDDGRVEALPAPVRHRLPRSGWGIERATRADVGEPPRLRRTLEDTPFYARSLLETTLAGQRVTAVHESISLRRFEHPLVQLMLPFRIRRGWRA
jgi:carotenoid 1,2-hydratase